MVKSKFLSILLLIGSLEISANESLNHKGLLRQALDYIGQSKPIALFDTHIQSKVRKPIQRFLGLGSDPASSEYQKLGKEAQEVLQVPQDRHVPIKKISPDSIMAPLVAALAEPNAIYVNEEKLNKRSHGTKRCNLFHEAVHKKYNDSSSESVIEIGSFFGSGIAAHTLINRIKPQGRYKILHALGVIAVGLGTDSFISTKYNRFRERRADIEGHYATQCFTCVEESAAHRKQSFEQENNSLKNNGYLWTTDLEKIAHDLKTDNKLCTFHKNSTSS